MKACIMRGIAAGVALLLLAAGSAHADVSVFSSEYLADDDRPRFSMSIKNESKLAVADVQYEVVFSTPGRSVPWATHTAQVAMPGGIEPGETRTLAPIDAPSELVSVEGYDVGVEVKSMAAYSMAGDALNNDAQAFLKERDEFLRESDEMLERLAKTQESAKASIKSAGET